MPTATGAPSHTHGLSFTRKLQPMSTNSPRTYLSEAVVAASGPGEGGKRPGGGGGGGGGRASAGPVLHPGGRRSRANSDKFQQPQGRVEVPPALVSFNNIFIHFILFIFLFFFFFSFFPFIHFSFFHYFSFFPFFIFFHFLSFSFIFCLSWVLKI